MKNIRRFLLALVAVLLVACNEDAFLQETPLDFMSGENSYITPADFELATNELYYLARWEFYCNGDRSVLDYVFGTDIFWNGSSGNLISNLKSDYSISGTIAQAHWDKLYSLIAQSNTIISRLPASQLTDEQKESAMAKALFFRGLSYRTLAYLYGGVPLQLEEVTKPKTDYTRATREATLQQAISDVKYAAEHLNDITQVKDGEVSSPAAYHLLSELYLAAGMHREAVNAASMVLKNPALKLMTSRFGSRSTENPGDVFWDLFRTNNQNRSTHGNTEGLWVMQMEAGVTGGGTDLNSIWSSPGSYLLERHCSPQTGLFRMYKGDVAYFPFTWPIGDYTGGRGIGTFVPTTHFAYDVWQSDFNNDIRNANHNFVRKFAINTVNASERTKCSSDFGDTLDIDNPPAGFTFLTGEGNQTTFPGRYLLCYQTKCTNPYDYPSALIANASTFELRSSAGGTYQDQYMFRLAETYLLRAEGYLGLNNKDSAAIDINAVRTRANATPVPSNNVTLDYILDERLREFGVEEKRRLTLGRLGADVFYDRVTRYNPYYTNSNAADPFTKTYTLWPIPLSAIESNLDAEIKQNPGYDQ